MIEPPWWLAIFPLVATPLVYAGRNSRSGVYLAALVSLFAGVLAASLPPTNVMRLAGRTFQLDPLTQYCMAILFTASAVLYLVGGRLPHGRYLLPLGLCLSGVFVIAGMSRHLAVTGITMTLAAIVSVPIIQGDRTGSTRAAWRLLMLMLVALPLFMFAAWRVDLYREDVQNATYLPQAAALVGVGFCVWLGAFPMHGWLTAIGVEAPPVAGALLLIGFPMMAVVTLAHVMAEATWFSWWTQAGHVLLLAGLVSAVAGGMLATVQRSLRSAMGYAALYDLGCLMIAFAAQGSGGAVALYAGLLTRAVGLVLLGVSTAVVEADAGDGSFAGIRGLAHRLPLATAGLLVGGITMAGLPLAAGFPVHWLMLHDLAQIDSRWIWPVVLAGLGVAIVYLRAVHAMLQPPTAARAASGSRPGWAPTAVIMVLILAAVALGQLPATLFRAAAHLVILYPLPHL
jgi:formate hydrogenlyase subunit 3/multisubunit Na+/H+ antiporter MnhD subunit